MLCSSFEIRKLDNRITKLLSQNDPYGRKRRRPKEPLDESESRE